MNIIKKVIYELLLENTEMVEVYLGGKVEPEVVAFKNSEGWELPSFIEALSDKIATKIEERIDEEEAVAKEEHEKTMSDYFNNR